MLRVVMANVCRYDGRQRYGGRNGVCSRGNGIHFSLPEVRGGRPLVGNTAEKVLCGDDKRNEPWGEGGQRYGSEKKK